MDELSFDEHDFAQYQAEAAADGDIDSCVEVLRVAVHHLSCQNADPRLSYAAEMIERLVYSSNPGSPQEITGEQRSAVADLFGTKNSRDGGRPSYRRRIAALDAYLRLEFGITVKKRRQEIIELQCEYLDLPGGTESTVKKARREFEKVLSAMIERRGEEKGRRLLLELCRSYTPGIRAVIESIDSEG